jgi:hypothetical protein
MRVYGVALSLATSTFVWWPEVGRWPPYHPAYERMFVAIFFAWGLALYRGDDVAYLLNSDAFVEDGALRTLLSHLRDNPQVGIAGGYIPGVDGEAQPGAFHYPPIWSEIEG